MATYQSPEARREEFRKYLEKAGVIDNLTRVLVGLYEEPERPNGQNAVEYVKRTMGAGGVDVNALKADNERLKEEVARLKQELAALQEGTIQ